MKKTKGMNRFQKMACKIGEQRVDREQIEELLEFSRSDDVEERIAAATYLCPCHVRRRIEDVWQALYRMLEDSDVRVRKAAWHTLEDGGRPDDPALDQIIERGLKKEPDASVRGFIERVAGPRKDKELAVMRMSRPLNEFSQRGHCDFCGKTNVGVKRDLDTMIPSGREQRAAWVCQTCAE